MVRPGIMAGIRRFFISVYITFFSMFIAAGQTEALRINEFLAINESVLADEDGDYSDWIEIFNPGTTGVSLAGWSLTDSKSQPRKWMFPDIIIKSNGYLLVYASGKNRNIAGKQMHTNFKLSGDGEYLALINPSGKAVSEFDPYFPVQQPDISWGYDAGSYLSFADPTPGSANSAAAANILPSPELSVKHGFFDAPFTLEILTGDQIAEVFYTVDGSKPGKDKGIKYTGPINISSTSVIRAVMAAGGKVSAKAATATYIFPDDVINQNNTPAGYPSLWGSYTGITGTAKADYEMDPEMMQDPVFANIVKDALLDLPTISIVTDRGYLFSKSTDPDTGGIYIYTGPPLSNTTNGTGFGWERPASVEYFDASDSVSLQVDCGLRIQGGHGRRAEKSPKHSFRLAFRSEYGPSKLNYPLFGNDANASFDNIILRAGFGNTWIHWSHSERAMAQYLRDRWTKDTQIAMGYNASHGIYVHLYINGMYWGIYNPSERMDKDFAAAYLGGDPDDYDVIKDYAEVSDGYIFAWNTLMNMANAGLSGPEAYNSIRGTYADGTRNPNYEAYVDVVNLADYMLINFYGGNWDWDHHNWVAIRNRVDPGKGFRFFCWDAEHMVETVNANILSENNNNCPSRVFQQLLKNAEFKRLFADRIQKHCFEDGVLTPESGSARWILRAAEIENAVNAESARWGDYRRDVHPWQNGPFMLYTKDAYWLPQMDFMLNTYFPGRTDAFINTLRNAGLFPSTDAPAMRINDKPVKSRIIKAGDTLSMVAGSGTIYYTTDGTDPVSWTGTVSISPAALRYTGEIILKGSSHIRARTVYNGVWSATNEKYFIVPSDYNDIKITEIHYHPLNETIDDNSEYEFIELKNTGTSILDLGGSEFIEGIRYKFPPETELRPKEFIVLASATDKFHDRYGFYPFGQYSGQLDNNGEDIIMVSPFGDTISFFSYDNANGWPTSPDGEGYSLVPVIHNPGDGQGSPDSWRASYHIGGSPGRDDLFISGDIVNRTSTDILTIYQNYPNPFTEATYIPYKLHIEADVEISVYSINGRKIVTLENSTKPKGEYMIGWRGTDQNGSYVANGIYLYRIEARSSAGSVTLNKRMVFIR